MENKLRVVQYGTGKIRQRFLQDKAKQAASQGTVVPGGGNARTDHRKSVMGKRLMNTELMNTMIFQVMESK